MGSFKAEYMNKDDARGKGIYEKPDCI